MTRRLAYTWTDVFASAPFCGNQLCVFPDADEVPLEVMQRITRELNHSETTFLQRPTQPGVDARVRILLPSNPQAVEIPFAGHPLLGSACVVARNRTEPSTVTLETGIGLVPVIVTPLTEGSWHARMQQPLPKFVRHIETSDELAQALGLNHHDIRSDLPIEAVDNGMQTVIIPIVSVEAVHQAVPDLARLRTLLGRDGLCTLLFAPGGILPNTDVHCRVFSPFDLVTEDPATGSANGPLGEYVVRHGLLPGPVVHSEQGYMVGRPSEIVVEVDRQDGVTKGIAVSGQVQLMGAGEFRLT